MSGRASEGQIDLAHMRVSYSEAGLDRSDLAPDWHSQFDRWLTEAVAAALVEPNAMVIATVDAAGAPTTRTVLAKLVDSGGVTFFTNYRSKKSTDLAGNPQISATFPWVDLHRQVHIRGRVERVSREVTDTYWATRWRESQIGAWASPQSTPVADRHELEVLGEEIAAKFVDTAQIPSPPHWGGWRIVPHTVEFWQGRHGRLHDRLVYRLHEGEWLIERLAP